MLTKWDLSHIIKTSKRKREQSKEDEKVQIPVVFNCGGYEKIETIRDLADYVDIWLPDLKYMDSGLSKKYSAAPDYFDSR